MIWPPVKAWTSLAKIDCYSHFVAINYGGKDSDRWVLLMSVLDSSVVVRVTWLEMGDPSKWKCGWDNSNFKNRSKRFDSLIEKRITDCIHLSTDSGLTIPINKKKIRPWFVILKD